jgi:hypothetical protein
MQLMLLQMSMIGAGRSAVVVPDTTAPTITSASSANYAENSTLSHSLTANEAVTWSIVGGADQARFEISGSTLRWAGNGTKDYETPNDADTNNTYVVQVRATDGANNTTDQTITITVTDVGEGSPKAYTYRDSISSTAGGHVVSASIDIGTAAADRYVLVACGVQNGDPDPISVVVNGVTLTKIYFEAATPTGLGFYSGLVASGSGPQTCAVTFTSASFEGKLMAVWTMTGLVSTTPKQTVLQASTSAPLPIPVDAGDFLFAVGWTVSGTPVFSSSTETPARDAIFAGGTSRTADWTIVSTNAAFSVAISGGTAHRLAVTFA